VPLIDGRAIIASRQGPKNNNALPLTGKEKINRKPGTKQKVDHKIAKRLQQLHAVRQHLAYRRKLCNGLQTMALKQVLISPISCYTEPDESISKKVPDLQRNISVNSCILFEFLTNCNAILIFIF
jgi:hypothetical protein